MCNSKEESVFHLLSNCAVLAPTLYKSRHDNALKCFIWPVLQTLRLISTPTPKWYEQQEIKPHYRNDEAQVWWDIPEYGSKQDPSDRAQRPDAKIKIERNEEKKIYIVEMTVPWMSVRKEKYDYKRGKYVNILNNLKLQNPDYEIDQITIVMDVYGGYDKELIQNIEKIVTTKEDTRTIVQNMQKVIISSLANISRTFKVRSKLNIV